MTLRWRWRTAIHEAGHAVAHVHLGGQVQQVSVRRDGGPADGRCWYGDLLPPWEAAVTALAGPCAQLFVTEDPDIYDRAAAVVSGGVDDQHGDWATARALAAEHRFDGEDAAEAAAQLVLEQWAAVEGVARALRGSRRGIVSGDRVREVVRR
jgi:hypothetical protein